MHNPGHPVRGGPGGPGGEMFRLKGLPQHCPGRPGWEGLQGQQRSSDHVHSLDRAGITGHLQLNIFHIWPAIPPKITPPDPRNPRSRRCTHTNDTRGPEFGIADTNDAKERPWPTSPDLHVHLLAPLPLTSPSLKTSSLDPEPSNDLPPRFNHGLCTTYHKALLYISLPLSTY